MLIILKLGGSVLTDKNKYMTADRASITHLAKVIAQVRKKKIGLIIVHGAGSFGHMPVKKYGIKDGIFTEQHKFGFADTANACSLLSQEIVGALLKEGVPAVSIPTVVLIKHTNKKIKRFDVGIVKDFLRAGYVPVMRGDMVLDDKIGGSISSGDEQVPYLARALKANRMVFGTDVDGIFTADPKTNKNAKLILTITRKNIKEVVSALEEAKTHDVTGGMKGKILEIISQARITPILIVNAKKPERLRNALTGKKVEGTLIKF